jgi:5-methylcytosine-specific restriction protein A
MARSVSEWIGKNDDSVPPPRVRIRVWEKWNGRCHITGRRIYPGDKWELDHIKPLIMQGENRESNLAPALTHAHREKTRDEVKIKAKVARARGKHISGTNEKKPWNSKWKKKMSGEVVRRDG